MFIFLMDQSNENWISLLGSANSCLLFLHGIRMGRVSFSPATFLEEEFQLRTLPLFLP